MKSNWEFEKSEREAEREKEREKYRVVEAGQGREKERWHAQCGYWFTAAVAGSQPETHDRTESTRLHDSIHRRDKERKRESQTSKKRERERGERERRERGGRERERERERERSRCRVDRFYFTNRSSLEPFRISLRNSLSIPISRARTRQTYRISLRNILCLSFFNIYWY